MSMLFKEHFSTLASVGKSKKSSPRCTKWAMQLVVPRYVKLWCGSRVSYRVFPGCLFYKTVQVHAQCNKITNKKKRNTLFYFSKNHVCVAKIKNGNNGGSRFTLTWSIYCCFLWNQDHLDSSIQDLSNSVCSSYLHPKPKIWWYARNYEKSG